MFRTGLLRTIRATVELLELRRAISLTAFETRCTNLCSTKNIRRADLLVNCQNFFTDFWLTEDFSSVFCVTGENLSSVFCVTDPFLLFIPHPAASSSFLQTRIRMRPIFKDHI